MLLITESRNLGDLIFMWKIKLHILFTWDHTLKNNRSRWDSMVTDLVIGNDMVLIPSQIFDNCESLRELFLQVWKYNDQRDVHFCTLWQPVNRNLHVLNIYHEPGIKHFLCIISFTYCKLSEIINIFNVTF